MKYFIIIIALLLTSSSIDASSWLTSYEKALEVAQKENKLILIDFWATWCGPCKKMDSEVWSDPEIKNLQSKFVSVKIDIDLDKPTASKYIVNSIPSVMILDSWGNLIHKESFMDKSKTKKLLSSFPQNIESINKVYYTYLEDEKNRLASLGLAEVYQAYVEVLTGKARTSFIKTSDKYFSKSKKQCKKSKDKLTMNKIDILKSLNQIYRGMAKKSVSNIEDMIKKEKVNPIYLPLAYYVVIVGCRESKLVEKEQKYMTMLVESKGNKPYLKKLVSDSNRS